ncbi:THAP domain-containing protein 2-like [Harpegnathos saltator]|uniref:THAP domain-containing protein 2-like n=1 Tax=Harpegnathos saltator TaxID=610380 RepID=UPI00058CD5CB|nr:THAP domain-containing protein 2-like [Harpegnathos saltator]
MPSCCVPGCKVRKDKRNSIYMASFPTNPRRKNQWMNNIGMGNIKSKYLVICETHFESNMWEKIRIDGKRKLKNNAVPTIFPARLHETNDCAGRQDNVMSNTLDIPDVTSSTLSNFADSLNEVKELKKQLAEANKKLDLANQFLLKSDRSKTMLKKQIKRLKGITKKSKTQYCHVLEAAMKKVFNENQITALVQLSLRNHIWSNDTIKKALRLKFSCGSSGYQELLKGNMPLPSERTLRRKLENIQLKEGISDDIFKLLEDKTVLFQDVRDRDCSLVLDEMSIAPG